jgi:hypothetical protein
MSTVAVFHKSRKLISVLYGENQRVTKKHMSTRSSSYAYKVLVLAVADVQKYYSTHLLSTSTT